MDFDQDLVVLRSGFRDISQFECRIPVWIFSFRKKRYGSGNCRESVVVFADDGEFLRRFVKRCPRDIAVKGDVVKSRLFEFVPQRLSGEVLEPVGDGSYPQRLHDGVLVQNHLVIVVFKNVSESVVFLRGPEPVEKIDPIGARFFVPVERRQGIDIEEDGTVRPQPKSATFFPGPT